MIIEFNEDSEYGQDILELVAMCVDLEDSTHNLTTVKKTLKEISGKASIIEMRLSADPFNRYGYLGGSE